MCLFIRLLKQKRMPLLWLMFLSVWLVSASSASAAQKSLEEVCGVVALPDWGMGVNDWCYVGETEESEEDCGKTFFAGIGRGSWDGRYAGSGDPDEDKDGWVGTCKVGFSEVTMEACRKAKFVWSGTACYDSAEDVPQAECLNREETYWGKSTKKCYPSPKARNEAEGKNKSGAK
jgi:hypothetical protein